MMIFLLAITILKFKVCERDTKITFRFYILRVSDIFSCVGSENTVKQLPERFQSSKAEDLRHF